MHFRNIKTRKEIPQSYLPEITWSLFKYCKFRTQPYNRNRIIDVKYV